MFVFIKTSYKIIFFCKLADVQILLFFLVSEKFLSNLINLIIIKKSNSPTTAASQVSCQLTKSCETMSVQNVRPSVRCYREPQVVQCIF